MQRTALALAATFACGLGSLALLGAGHAQPPAPAPVKSPDTGYCIGFDIGREVRDNLSRDGVTADPDAVIKGFTDALRGAAPAVPEADITKTLAALQKTLDERRVKDRLQNDPVFRAASEQASTRSKEFLQKFAQRPTVQKLPGGILYEVVRAGSGEQVKDAPAITVTFQTYLASGELVNRADNARVVVDQLVAGAQQTLPNMKVGDRWYVAVPPELAFGAVGQAPRVGPNEVLIADVEILGIAK